MNALWIWFKHWLEDLLVRIWLLLQPTPVLEGGPRESPQPTDNVMRTMNLVMPLKNKTAVGRAEAALAIASCIDEIYTALDNVGTVHAARFTIVDNNLLMFSYYDGDFHTYIRDFIMTLGHAFDGIMALVEDPPPVPCWKNIDAFIEWIHQRDAFQLPQDPARLVEVVAPNLENLEDLSRYLALQMQKNPNVQIGAYRAYPGYSVAQLRDRMGGGLVMTVSGEVAIDQGPSDLSDIQGNVLRGYRKQRVRHLVLTVADAAAARGWLAAAAGRGYGHETTITNAADWGERPPEVCINVAFTFEGLRALGAPQATLRSFPVAFREGMPARAGTLGDWGDSAPQHWQAWWRDAGSVHLMASLHADSADALDRAQATIASAGEGRAFRLAGRNDGAWFNGDEVHFGYRDNISQPRFPGVDPRGRYDDQPPAPYGTVLLGYPTALEQLLWTVPTPRDFGFNGAFNAFRILEQDVAGFETYLDTAADELAAHAQMEDLLPDGVGPDSAARHAALREVVAAKFCGRWRTGTPLALSPRDPAPDPPVSETHFDYAEDHAGLNCPIGAHARRANPRSARIVQRMANHTRRLVRRGIPYGPKYDPRTPDGLERGLLGGFLCADLSAQFESVQYDWINLGLLDPRVTGANDPLLGDNDHTASWFDVPTRNGTVRLRGFPRFVRARGGAYLFIPSLTALRWLGEMSA